MVHCFLDLDCPLLYAYISYLINTFFNPTSKLRKMRDQLPNFDYKDEEGYPEIKQDLIPFNSQK